MVFAGEASFAIRYPEFASFNDPSLLSDSDKLGSVYRLVGIVGLV